MTPARRTHSGLLLAAAGLIIGTALPSALAQGTDDRPNVDTLTQILGRPTDRSVALNVLSPSAVDAYVEYGTAANRLTSKTRTSAVPARTPTVLELTGLSANRTYTYRLRTRAAGATTFASGALQRFTTQRARGTTFTFTIQGDSHPERAGKMYDAALYEQTLRQVASEQPDFHILLGDDFSLDRLIERGTLTKHNVEQVYADQRRFLGAVGASTRLFLVNGNHEQAARTHLDGTPGNPAVLAGNARNAEFALPAPDAFYTGDAEAVPFVGLPRDYYAWTWGDALFVVMDPYWHSPVPIDVATGDDDKQRGARQRDWWGMTIGDEQYRWLQRTLSTSKATYKFVFAHHVHGTGRGGVEQASLYEWGGHDPNGNDTFATHRPGWEMPIHQLFVTYAVTAFFQGHDHLYAHQELDGVTYQETPNPADPTATAFNREAYTSGTILPNSGHLRVTVAPTGVRVDYVGTGGGTPADSYTIPAPRR